MAMNNQDWENLGQNIQDIVDRAVNSHDYEKMNQTIRRVVEKAVDIGGDTVRRVVDEASRKASAPTKPRSYQPVVEERDVSVLYGSTGGKTAAGILKIVGGGILSLTAVGVSIASAIISLVTGAGFVGAAVPLLGVGGGAWLISSGIGTLNWLSRFKTYRKVLGNKTSCALDKLARSVGKNVKFVRKELQNMIGKGLFLEGHLNKEQTQLITSHETYQLFEQSRLQLEARQRQAEVIERQKSAQAHKPEVQEVLDKGEVFLDQIRRCNDAIPGQEISDKISRMETIVERIFDRAEAHPEVIPDLKKMMDYYLPMTVKLLNAYADMDAQPVQGENIAASKREIEQTLDTLNQAFEKLLDDLFMDTAMDVSSDITVLNTLLAQEGLKDDELSKMQKQAE